MGDLRHSFDPVFFSSEEKEQLAARLKGAAEQEDNMKDSTKRTIRHASHRMIIGGLAAALLTMGALAATVGGGLRGYFEVRTPEDQSTLEEGIYQVNRQETYNGWSIQFTDCIGDDTTVYLWGELIAPEGTALAKPENGSFTADFRVTLPEGVNGGYSWGFEEEQDADPTDNRLPFLLKLMNLSQSLRGEAIDITLGPITDVWWTDPGTDQAQRHEGSALTEAIQDYTWVFEDVLLDFPDQTIRLTPNVEVPYLDGTATLTQVEVSPLNTLVRIEGGACYDHHRPFPAQSGEASEPEEVIEVGGITITVEGGSSEADYWSGESCWGALDVSLVLEDGTVLETPSTGIGSRCEDGTNPYEEETPFVEKFFGYAEASNILSPRVIDPAQVDHILVCGVPIQMPETDAP